MDRKNKIISHIPDIISKATKLKNLEVKPYYKDILKALSHIELYLKKNKNKIYGGLALEKNIQTKDKSVKIYDDDHIPDYDIYSPVVLEDIYKICNILFENGFMNVSAVEANHKQTYTIYVEYIPVLDVSYIPKYIYDHISTIIVNDLHYVGVQFLYIDIYRQYIDPLRSYDFRLDKIYKRGSLVEKHYPPIKPKVKYVKKQMIYETKLKLIFDKFIKGNKTILLVGPYAYNTFIRKSKDNNAIKDVVNHFKIISTDYKIDIKKLQELLKDVKTQEYYPFYQFYDTHTEFSYDGHTILYLYNHYGRCIPVKHVLDKSIRIGSYHVLVMFLYILKFRMKLEKKKDENIRYAHLLYNLVDVREKFLKKNKLIGIENTLFQELQIKCLGKTMDSRYEARLRKNEKIKTKKQYPFKYEPLRKIIKEPHKYFFENQSGNLKN